ncbi:MAG TPA: hypothetical protein VIO43_13025 [Lutibacter sp.]
MKEEEVCRDFRHTTQHGAMKEKSQSKIVEVLQSRCHYFCGVEGNFIIKQQFPDETQQPINTNLFYFIAVKLCNYPK